FPARADLALELARGGAESAAVAQIESLPAAQRTLPEFHIYGAWTALAAGDIKKAGGHVQALVNTRASSGEAALVAALYAAARRRPVAAREAALIAIEKMADPQAAGGKHANDGRPVAAGVCIFGREKRGSAAGQGG